MKGSGIIVETIPLKIIEDCYPRNCSKVVIKIIEEYRRDILDKNKSEFYFTPLTKKFLRQPKYKQEKYFNWISF